MKPEPEKKWYEPHFSVDENFEIKEDSPEDEVMKVFEKNVAGPSKSLNYWFNVLIRFPKMYKANETFIKTAIFQILQNNFLASCEKPVPELLIPIYRLRSSNDQVKSLNELYLKVLDDAITLFPNDKTFLNYKGVILYKMNRLDDALKQFEAASLQDGNWIYPYYNKAVVLQNQKLYEELLKLYQDLKIRFPQEVQVRLSLGKLYTKLFMFPQALAEFEECLSMKSDMTAQIIACVGRIQFLRKDFNQSRLSFEKAILQEPDDPTANHYYGDYLMYHKKWAEALIKYDKGFYSEGYRYVSLQEKRAKEEKNTSDTESSNFPKEVKEATKYELDNYFWKIINHIRAGQFNQCLEFLKKLKELFPKNPEIRIFMAKIYISFNDLTNATAELNEGLANIGQASSWRTHFSQPVLAYKMEILDKKTSLFKLLFDIIGIDANIKIIAIMNARNALVDSVFKLYRNKLLINYCYLPQETDFANSVDAIKLEIESFKSKLADQSSTFYIPHFIQSNHSLLKYYNILLKKLIAFEDFYQHQTHPQGQETSGFQFVLNDSQPLIKIYKPLSSKKGGCSLNIKNLEKFDSDSVKRKSAFTDMAQLMAKLHEGRIHTASSSKEINLLIEEGIFGKFNEYFHGSSGMDNHDSVELLARIDALKIFLIICSGNFNQKPGIGLLQKTNEIVEQSKNQFAVAKSSSCLCFR